MIEEYDKKKKNLFSLNLKHFYLGSVHKKFEKFKHLHI